MNGDYLSITPHEEQLPQFGDEVINVSTYKQMENVLVELVEAGAESAIISADSFNMGTLRYNIETAIGHITKESPICAYAVKDIKYEIGTNRVEPVIAFKISYLHGRSELLRIKKTNSMNEAIELVKKTLENCNPSLVLRVDHYADVDFVQIVQDYANENPDIVMEIPQVVTNAYPQQGDDRVIEMFFTYQTSREKLREMQELVAGIFTSAELYVKETAQINEIYTRLYSFLIERNKYTIETSITPTYSLLHHGVGDSRAFANVYSNMCRREELDCRVVSGTRDGIPWCWNVVRYRGKFYHVDLIRSKEMGQFMMFTPEEMTGYVWDYTLFPRE